MTGRLPKSWLVFLIGMSGCAAPGLSDPEADLPYAGVTTNTPALRQVCLANGWSTPPGQPISTGAYHGNPMVTMAPSDLADDPCAQTRMATRPVCRFLHNLFCPDPPRLTPRPLPMDPTALAQFQVPPGYHARKVTSEGHGEIITASAQGMPGPVPGMPTQLPEMPEVAQAGPALEGSEVMQAGPALAASPLSRTEILQATFTEAANPGKRLESIGATMPLAPTPSKTAETGDGPPGPPMHLVCERSIRLNCKLRDVGPSGLSAVEVWYTQDGKRWLKAEHTCPPQPPYVMDVKDDGRYGITLIARNGLGMSKAAPVLGEAPQVWVEVDTTKPAVQVGKARFGGTDGARELAIAWSASDKNLGARPIKLAYGETPQGPWMPIADVENTGAYAWRLPAKVPATFFVRVQATDIAGNTTAAVSAEPVVLDLSRPTVEILSVEAYKRR